MKRTAFPPRQAGLSRTGFRRSAEAAAGGPVTVAVAWSSPSRGTGKGKSPARTGSRSRAVESFPPAVAALIDARDPWCIHCGNPNDLHRHHRRLKGAGGDGRDHTQCACNGVRLCVNCHVPWAHLLRAEAEAEGIIIPRAETGPWRRPLMVHTAAQSGFMAWLTCEGDRVTEMPEGALAALDDCREIAAIGSRGGMFVDPRQTPMTLMEPSMQAGQSSRPDLEAS